MVGTPLLRESFPPAYHLSVEREYGGGRTPASAMVSIPVTFSLLNNPESDRMAPAL